MDKEQEKMEETFEYIYSFRLGLLFHTELLEKFTQLVFLFMSSKLSKFDRKPAPRAFSERRFPVHPIANHGEQIAPATIARVTAVANRWRDYLNATMEKKFRHRVDV